MTLWKVNFCSARNWREGSTLPVVRLRLPQFDLVRIPLAHRSVNFTVLPNSFRVPELFTLITPLAMFKICLLYITPAAYQVPIAISLTFRIRWLSKIFGLLTFFRTTSPSQTPSNLFFQLFTDVLMKLWLGYFNANLLMAEEVWNIYIFGNLLLILLRSTV